MTEKSDKEKRIEVIKAENNQINAMLTDIANKREELIQKALINNGRILELQNQMKEKNDGPTNKK